MTDKEWDELKKAEQMTEPYRNKNGVLEFESEEEMKDLIQRLLGIDGTPVKKIYDNGPDFAFLVGPFKDDDDPSFDDEDRELL